MTRRLIATAHPDRERDRPQLVKEPLAIRHAAEDGSPGCDTSEHHSTV